MYKKVFIIGGSHQYTSLFCGAGFHQVFDISKADFVCFTGGEDVSPSYYGEEIHPKTFCNFARDAHEKRLFEALKGDQIPMVGICRGGQFLNVMNGGRMYQHVTLHTTPHELVDVATGQVVEVSSTHHQMMRPGKEALLIAVAHLGGTKESMEGSEGNGITQAEEREPDVEVLYYPSSKSLCFQPHPEFFNRATGEYKGMRDYFLTLLNQYFDLGATI